MHGDIPGCQLHRKMLSARSRFRPCIEARPKTAQGEAVRSMVAPNLIPLCIGVSAKGICQHEMQRLYGNSLKRTNLPVFGTGSQ
jgi:hypothetical protein